MKLPRPAVAVIGGLLMSASLATVAARAAGADEPWWAYGFVTPPAPGEKAAMPAGPARVLRPNEDASEQMRKRHIEGSAGAYSLFEIRNGTQRPPTLVGGR